MSSTSPGPVNQVTTTGELPLVNATTAAAAANPLTRPKVVVIWDGVIRTSYPPDLFLPPGSLATLPPGTLAGYKDSDRLLDDLVRWADHGPTVMVLWQGLPDDALRHLKTTARVLGRDRVVTLPLVRTPLAALSIGWRVALLVNAVPPDLVLDTRHVRALGLLVGGETQSLAVLSRPGRSPLVEFGRIDFVRAMRSGRKLVRWAPHAVVSKPVAGVGLLEACLPADAVGGPRLALLARAGSEGYPDLGVSPADAVVEIEPGSLDGDAWGQRTYTELAVSPRGVDHLNPALTGWRLCPGCERLVQGAQVVCDWCTLPS